MPSLGSDMEGAILVEWLVQPGSEVKRGDILAVVETDKGAIEIEVFDNGILERTIAAIGDDIAVGGPLAEIRTAGATAEPDVVQTTPAAAAPKAASPAPPAPAVKQKPAPVQPVANRRASPAARRLAAAERIELASLNGTGPQDAIVLADVERAMAARPQAPTRGADRRGIDPAAMRRAIAQTMARSKREIPHYYLKHTVDADASIAWLQRTNADREPADRILLGALVIKATALALLKHSEFNGFYADEEFRASERVHVGTAISIRGGGLVAPALHDADRTPLPELMTRLRDLVQRVRAGRFRASELSDPTVTVSSLGDRGVEELYGVIYPPQVACIGFGRVVERPWVGEDGTIVARSVITITLAADHRVSDGHRGALLLRAIGDRLAAPEQL